MPRYYKPVDPSKVVKIECFELPTHRRPNEGEYELRWGHKPKDVEYHDIMSLYKALQELWPERAEDILNRLQNFRKAFLNLATGEVTS